MNYFNDIILDSEFFLDLPDCITDGNAYKEKFENAFKLTNGILQLGAFSWEAANGKYEFQLEVNNRPVNISLAAISDYVDSDGLIAGLNEILRVTGYEGDRHFCDINGGVADFGVAFITPSQEGQLAEKGLIYRDPYKVDVSAEPKKEDNRTLEEKAADKENLLKMLSRWSAE